MIRKVRLQTSATAEPGLLTKQATTTWIKLTIPTATAPPGSQWRVAPLIPSASFLRMLSGAQTEQNASVTCTAVAARSSQYGQQRRDLSACLAPWVDQSQ